MQRFILVFTAVLWSASGFNTSVWAQKDSTSTSGSSTLTIGTEYSTNTNVLGSVDSYVSQPSFTSALTYKCKKGVSLLFSPIFVGNSDSTNSKFTSEYDFGANYSLTVSKKLSITPSYTHYLYSTNSASLKSGFNDNAQVTTSLVIKWWTTSVIAAYGWGQTNDFSLSPTTSATIKFTDFLGEDNSLSFQPTIGLVLNKNELKNLNDKKKTKGLADFVKLYPTMTATAFLNSTDPTVVAWRKAHPAVVSSISNKLKKISSKSSGKKQKTDILLSDLLAVKSKFGITSINISLPISYEMNDFTFTTNLQYTKPNNQTDPSSFYVSFGVSYSFGL